MTTPSNRTGNRLELAAATAVTLFGLFVAVQGAYYDVGTIRRIGPGFFPVSLGVLLAIMGTCLVFQARRGAWDTGRQTPFKSTAAVIAGVIAFGVLAPRAGLMAATAALVVCACLFERKLSWTGTAAIVIFLCLIGYSVFVSGFGVQLNALWW